MPLNSRTSSFQSEALTLPLLQAFHLRQTSIRSSALIRQANRLLKSQRIEIPFTIVMLGVIFYFVHSELTNRVLWAGTLLGMTDILNNLQNIVRTQGMAHALELMTDLGRRDEAQTSTTYWAQLSRLYRQQAVISGPSSQNLFNREALAASQKARDLAPDNVFALCEHALALQASGHFEDALQLLNVRSKQSLKRSEATFLRGALGMIYFQQAQRMPSERGQFLDHAIRLWAEYFDKGGKSLEIRISFARAYLQSGKTGRAIELLEERIQKHPESIEVLLALAGAFNQKLVETIGQKKENESTSIAAQIAQFVGQCFQLVIQPPYTGLALEHREQYLAQAYYERGYARLLLAQFLRHPFTEPISDLVLAVQYAPGNEAYQQVLDEARQKETPMSTAATVSTIESLPDPSVAAGMQLLQQVSTLLKTKGGLFTLQQVKMFESNSAMRKRPLYWVRLSQIYRFLWEEPTASESDQGLYLKGAKEAVAEALKLNPSLTSAVCENAYVLQLEGKLEESLLRLQQRLEAQLELGDQVKLLSTGGNVLMRESIRLHADYEQHRALRARAITFFERSVALSVKAPETVHRLASLYLEDGDADRAIAVLQKRLDKRRYSFDTLLFLCKAYNQKLFSLKAQMKSEEEMTPVLEALIAQCKLAIHTLSFATPEWMTDQQKLTLIASAHFERAFGEILIGHHLSAIDHLKTAITYHASEISYYEALVSSYVIVGDLVKATGVLVAVRQAGFSAQIIEQLKAMIPSTHNGKRARQVAA